MYVHALNHLTAGASGQFRLYYITENLELRHDKVAQRITNMTGTRTALDCCYNPLFVLQVMCSAVYPVGRDVEDCRKEVDSFIQRLFYWGAYADKYGGQVQVRSCDCHVTVTSVQKVFSM